MGYVEPGGVDLSRCQVRCSSLHLELDPIVQVAAIDAQGRFEIGGLADTDYCVEIVVRANPALVLGRMEYVRPGGAEVVIHADPLVLFGAAGTSERDSQ